MYKLQFGENRCTAVVLPQITEALSMPASDSGLPVGSDSEHFLALYASACLSAYPTPRTIRAISRKADFQNAILCRAASVTVSLVCTATDE